MQGWISLHRQFIEWEWYTDANTMRLFIHCLVKANHADKTWRGIDISRGQFLTSIDSLSRELSLSSQNIRTSLKKLKSTGEITIKTTSKYSIISIACYDKYQDSNKQNNKQSTNNQQTTNKQLTTTNNDNNVNNDNNTQESKIPPCPHEKIIDLYHKVLPELQGVNKTLWKGSKREKDLTARWRQNEEFRKSEFWTWYFQSVKQSAFHMGENDRHWKADLGWLVKKENFIKMVEKYSG